ncbi:MAG: ROK family protein [Candidatus Borkfalkiaceae bacterium]|nr:ROK family protein [Christensenellaceae bacterium]
MKYVIGYDIGGTKCAVSLGKVEEDKITILSRKETPTTKSSNETLSALEEKTREFITANKISAIGISCGGPLDSKQGKLYKVANLPGWEDFHIVEYLENKFGIKAYLQNDANACALVEWKYGAGKGTKNMVFITMGTGLGAGLIIDGKLYSGTNDNAGEVGHIRLADDGPIGFGKTGSFEGFCSGGGIARLAESMGAEKGITTKRLAEQAKGGDELALRVFEKSGEMLGKGLSVLIDILNPERIVIGGVYMRANELLLPSMERVLKQESLNFAFNVCEIVPALLSENIGDYAAISVALSEICVKNVMKD